MIYGYARVSTKGQARDGNSLEEQEIALKSAGCETILHDSVSGAKMIRPNFTKLMGMLSDGDTFVVTKLDRFARSAGQGIVLIEELRKHGVIVRILNIGTLDDSSMGNLLVNVLLSFAQFERDMIKERTSAGKAIARANNPDWREGRRKKEIKEDDVTKYREKIKKGEMTVTDCCKALGISRTLWYSRMKEVA